MRRVREEKRMHIHALFAKLKMAHKHKLQHHKEFKKMIGFKERDESVVGRLRRSLEKQADRPVTITSHNRA